MPIVALADIILRISYIFLKIKIWNKKYTLRMNPTTCSTSLSKIYLFLQSLVASHFCLSFSLNFIF